jgi:hypothetical protein
MMKRRLLVVAAFALALSLQSSLASATRLPPEAYTQCFNENYGGGTCAQTCVAYNDQGSVIGHITALHPC